MELFCRRNETKNQMHLMLTLLLLWCLWWLGCAAMLTTVLLAGIILGRLKEP